MNFNAARCAFNAFCERGREDDVYAHFLLHTFQDGQEFRIRADYQKRL